MSRPWMPLYIADYLADTGHLRAAESGAYLHLIMHYWQRGCLPTEDRQLATIAKMTDVEWQEARPVIEPLFQLGWRHKRVDTELARAEEKYHRRAAAGKKGAAARSKQCSSNAQAELNHKSVVVDKSTTSLHEEPTSEDLFAESIGSEVARARSTPRASRLSDDWQPTIADLEFARTLLVHDCIPIEIEKFRDHYHSRAGPNAVSPRWSARWRNWCRKAIEINRANGNASYRKTYGNGAGQGGDTHAVLALKAARRAAAAFGQDG